MQSIKIKYRNLISIVFKELWIELLNVNFRNTNECIFSIL
jgi:hypothetical protein